MHRPALPLLACVLSLTSGLALLGLAASIAAPPGDEARAQANEAVVRRFYAAINTALRTGDTRALDGLIDADFAEHPPRPGLPSGRLGLVRALSALRTSSPTVRRTVEDVWGAGDRVAARVRVEGAADGALPGGAGDVFRLADGRIVERWGLPPGFGVSPTDLRTLPLERRSFEPGSRQSLDTSTGAVVIAVETGRLGLTVERAAGRASPPASARSVTTVLAPGDVFLLPKGSAAIASAGPTGPAVALTLTFPTFPSPTGAAARASPARAVREPNRPAAAAGDGLAYALRRNRILL